MSHLRLLVMLCLFSAFAIPAAKAQVSKPAKNTKTVAAKPGKPVDQRRVKITTDSGIIIVKLYDSTPLHRDNFLKLVKQGLYDSLLFHRIIPEFMIQGGDPMSKNATQGAMLGMGGAEMTRIPSEFKRSLIHKKGALAAARDGNPEKASSACQFYIVQGKKIPLTEIAMYEQNKGFTYTVEQKNIYQNLGGTPMLDMEYTVFGEVVSGLEVVDKIAKLSRDGNNRPNIDIRMKMEIIK
jgi:peptidyl-prolyl cis-trans isomerase B (cyclophilin B)